MRPRIFFKGFIQAGDGTLTLTNPRIAVAEFRG